MWRGQADQAQALNQFPPIGQPFSEAGGGTLDELRKNWFSACLAFNEPEAELAMAAEETHARGRRISAHARSAESIKRCIRHGVTVIYHATFADEEALDMLEANRDKLFVSPNIGFTAAQLAAAIA